MVSPIKLFSTHYLEVKWDNEVCPNLKPCYQRQTQARIPIRLFNLLKGLGSVQPKRLKPSLMSTFVDYGFLVEKLKDVPEFELKIQETRAILSSEMLTEVSELMGIGLSVVVVKELFDIQESTINKIKSISSQRPDWQCLTRDNRKLIVEAKGSINKYTSTQQLKGAVDQKNAIAGDVKIATATVLNEDIISVMTVVDPPITSGEQNEMQRHAFRAYHYASVFSFLGDDVLSLYFEKMARRLSGRIREREMNDKEMMYKELTYHAPTVLFADIECSGHLYGPMNNQYLFLGVDKTLLSYRGFIDYNDAEEERIVNEKGNEYILQPDGILVINITNPTAFQERNQIEAIGVGMDRIALSDLDSLRGNSFKRYVKYLLDKCVDNTEWISGGQLRATIGGKSHTYILHHVRNPKSETQSSASLKRITSLMEGKDGVLVTNIILSRESVSFPCVSREDFRNIALHEAQPEIVRNLFWESAELSQM